MQGGRLDRESLTVMIDAGDVDTVLVVFPDLQGRLDGQAGHRPLLPRPRAGDGSASRRATTCSRSTSTWTPSPGYRFANWETGLRRLQAAVPDLATLRLVPWLEKTALVLCDLVDEETGEPVEVSPRRILRRQIERAAAAGLHGEVRLRARVLPVPGVVRRGRGEGLHGPHAAHDGHRGLPHPPDHPGRVPHPPDPQRHGRRGRPGRVLEGRGRPRPARDQPALRRRARDGRPPHHLQERGQGDRRPQRPRASRSWPSTPWTRCGSSCHIHSSLWDADGRRAARCGTTTPPTTCPRSSARYLGGLVAREPGARRGCSPRTSTRTSATSPSSWAPTAIAWGRDNRTCGLRLVGHGPGFRVESRIPGRRRQPLPRLRRHHRRRARTASSTTSTPAPPFDGNAYEADRRPPGARRRSSRRSTCSSAARSRPRRSARTSTTTSSTPPDRSGPRSTASSPTGNAGATSSSSDSAAATERGGAVAQVGSCPVTRRGVRRQNLRRGRVRDRPRRGAGVGGGPQRAGQPHRHPVPDRAGPRRPRARSRAGPAPCRARARPGAGGLPATTALLGRVLLGPAGSPGLCPRPVAHLGRARAAHDGAGRGAGTPGAGPAVAHGVRAGGDRLADRPGGGDRDHAPPRGSPPHRQPGRGREPGQRCRCPGRLPGRRRGGGRGDVLATRRQPRIRAGHRGRRGTGAGRGVPDRGGPPAARRSADRDHDQPDHRLRRVPSCREAPPLGRAGRGGRRPVPRLAGARAVLTAHAPAGVRGVGRGLVPAQRHALRADRAAAARGGRGADRAVVARARWGTPRSSRLR